MGKCSSKPQPGPAQEAKPELIYFDGPGRGEIARLAFKAANVDFTDTRHDQQAWPDIKKDPESAPAKCFGSMPVLSQGDFLLAQSQAVAQYAFDLGLAKAKIVVTPQQRALDMMMMGVHADIQAAMYKCLFGDDESKAKGKEALPGAVTPLLQGIERQYKGDGPFLYREGSPSLGDLAVYNLVESPFPGLKALAIDMAPFAKITALSAAVTAALDGEKKTPTATAGPAAEGKPELIYFDGPGRAELARLAFAAGGVEYTDTRYSFEQWPAVKGDAQSVPAQMFGSMPVIKHGDFCAAQSMAVAQYAADLGLNKAQEKTEQQRAQDMMILGAHAEIQALMYKCLFGDDESKAKGMEELSDKVTPILQGIERQYKSSGPFLYNAESKGPSLGDLALVNLVTSPFPGLVALKFDVAPFKKITTCVEACKNSKSGTLADYLSKK